MAMNVGELFAELNLDDSKFSTGLSNSKSMLAGMGAKLGTMAAGIGVAVGAALGFGIMEGMSQEASADKAAARLGLSDTEAERLGSLAGAIYSNNFGESVEANSGAVADIWRSFGDIGDDDLQAVTESALTIADVFDSSFEEVNAAARELFRNGIAPDAQAAMDIVAATMRDTKGPTDEILASITEYAGFFDQVGLGAENMGSILTSEFATNQYVIDRAGDAIKEFGIRVQDGSALSEDALKDLGFSMSDVQLAMAEGGEVAGQMTEDIIKALIGMDDPIAQRATGIALFGTQFEELEGDAIPVLESLFAGMGDVAGASQAMADQAYSNVSGTLAGAWRTFKQVFIEEVWGAVEPVLATLAGWLSEVLPAAIDTFRDVFSGAAELVSGVVGGMGEETESLGSTFASVWTTISGIVEVAVDIIGDLLANMRGWFIENQDKITEVMGKIRDVIATVTEIIARLWDTWGETIMALMRNAWDTVLGIISGALDVIMGVLDVFVGLFTGDWDRMKEGLLQIWDGLWEAVVSVLSGLWGQISAVFDNLESDIFDAGMDVVRGFWEGIKSMGSWLADKIGGFISDNVPSPIKSVLGIASPSKLMAEYGQNIVQGLALGMSGQLDMLGRTADQVANAAIPDPMASLASLMATGGARGGLHIENMTLAGLPERLAADTAREMAIHTWVA